MKDRILELMKCLNVSNKAEFARQMGWKPQYLNNILNGSSIGLSPIISLLNNYPNLNARWLLLGEGNMFLEDNMCIIKNTPNSIDDYQSHSHADSVLKNDVLNNVVDENMFEDYEPNNVHHTDVNSSNFTLENFLEEDLRTPMEKERDACHSQIRQMYLELVAQFPGVKPHRIITAIANQFKRSIPNIRAILISQGVYHKK